MNNNSKLKKVCLIVGIIICMCLPWAGLLFLRDGLPHYFDAEFKDPDFPHLPPLLLFVVIGILGIWLATRISSKIWKRITIALVAINVVIYFFVFSFGGDFDYYEWNGEKWEQTNWMHNEKYTNLWEEAYGEYLMVRHWGLGSYLNPVYDPSGSRVGYWREQNDRTFGDWPRKTRTLIINPDGFDPHVIHLIMSHNGEWEEDTRFSPTPNPANP